MADSFFGFDASIPNDDDGGGGLEETEDTYDALNSETFGSATNGDWENIHENLVRLDRRASEIKDDHGESDLVLNLSRVGMNDFDVAKEDSEGRIQLDPSVWASPFKPPEAPAKSVHNDPFFYPNPDTFLRHYFSNPFAGNFANIVQPHQPPATTAAPPPDSRAGPMDNQIMQRIEQNLRMDDIMMDSSQMQLQMMSPKPPIKILSLEDIERNMHKQQQQQTKTLPTNVATTVGSRSQTPSLQIGQPNQRPPSSPINSSSAAKRPPTDPNHPQPPNMSNGAPPPPPQPIANGGVPPNKLPPRMPPGFPAMPPMMGGPGHPPIGSPLPMHPGNLPLPGGMHRPPPHFAMHPNFNGMRPPPNMVPPPLNHQRMPMQMMQPPPNHPNHPNFAQNMQFNQRLVQEIQQNHPMLPPFNRLIHPNLPPMHPNMQMHPMVQMQMQQQQQHHHHLQQQQQQHQQQHHMHQQYNNNNHGHGYNQGGNNKGQYPLANQKQFSGNGNLSEDYDEYANMMSKGNKQWLITIQLAQVETGTPYIDDYYYTVYKERKTKVQGERESQAHKDNQMNHPFSQPTGNALLVQMSLSNKDNNNRHYQNQRNNSNNHNNNNTNSSNHLNSKNRERKSSESKDNNQKEPRNYKPLQFENSLGQLQVSSVTAPRKLIDMDIVGSESSSSPGSLSFTLELTTQRKSRQLLIHIESLYRVVLKLEDYENPAAIATAKVIKERKDRERAQALELQKQIQSQLNDSVLADDITEKLRKLAPALEPDHDLEDRAELMAKLLVGLAPEKAAQMMTVRKGKTLLLRALVLIKDLQQRWNIWYGICSTLPIIVKKDKDDVDGKLMAMFPAFKEQLMDASMAELLKLTSLMTATVDVRKINYMFMNKFCISCIIVLLLRAEALFTAAPDSISAAAESEWATFLTIMSATAAANLQSNAMLGTTLQSDIIKPLVNHFNRFSDVQSQPLMAVLTQETA